MTPAPAPGAPASDGMLPRLIAFSLRYSSLIVMLSVLLITLCAYQLPRFSVDVFPELNAPTVVILTEAGGLAAAL